MGTRVAIACQGGGSHTAFTAGVLGRLCDHMPDGDKIVGLSGTSGGAVCALLTWAALRPRDRAAAARRPDPMAASRSLEEFWAYNSATSPWDHLLNVWVMLAGDLEQFVVMPAISPYANVLASSASQQFKAMLRRCVDFDLANAGLPEPVLVIGAVNVLSGEFRAFNSRDDAISAETVLASAALPTLFRAVSVGGETFWDGLFSQNPPIRELVDLVPDEIWVIQIDRTCCDDEPRTVLEIADRRNELAGNLSLYQELRFVEKINQWLDEQVIARGGRFQNIVVRVLELCPSRVRWPLTARSKLNRDPAFIHDLIEDGRAQADDFSTALAFERAWIRRDREQVLALLADDVELESTDPFPRVGPTRGSGGVGAFVADAVHDACFSHPFTDPSRKQVVGEHVLWTVQTSPADHNDRRLSRAEIALTGGRITSLTFGLGN